MTDENERRYWFVFASFEMNVNGSHKYGTGNLGIGSYKFLNNEHVKSVFKQNFPDIIDGTIVVQNFIELTKKDYLEFWSK